MGDKLLTPTDLADLCGVPLATVYQWRHRRTGPVGIRVGKHIRFRAADIDAWLDAHADRPQPAA